MNYRPWIPFKTKISGFTTWVLHRFSGLILVLALAMLIMIITGCRISNPSPDSPPGTEPPTLEIKSSPTGTQTPFPTQGKTLAPTDTATHTSTLVPPTKTPNPTATPIQLPEGVEAFTLKTEDGLDLAGFLHSPKHPVGEPIAVLLAHEYYSSLKSWEPFAERLVEAGFTTLTFDFRGHGDSPGSKDFSAVGIDVKAGIKALRRQSFEQIICIGASMGGTGCMANATDMGLIGLANLSGPMDLDAGRLVTRADLEALTIPKIFMVAEEDQAGTDFVADFVKMVEMAPEPKGFYLYPGYAHASGLLYDVFGEEVQEILLDFVKDFSESPQDESVLNAFDCEAAGLLEIACTGVTSNQAWTPVIQEFDGVEMALVPAGCFMMGNDEGFAEEQPEHEICFNQPFWIDLTEVTVSQFTKFLNDQDASIDNLENWRYQWYPAPPEPDQLVLKDDRWGSRQGQDYHPIESVTWVGADAYCACRGERLPTEAEWEYAARGPDSLIYPWGNELIIDNVVRVHYRTKVPEVGSKPQGASWVGALDMSSSLFEWVNSLYRPYPYKTSDGREAGLDVDDSSDRILRGSSWYHPEGMVDNLSTTARFNVPPNHSAWYFGIRCVRSTGP